MSLPGEARASADYGIQGLYQLNQTKSSTTNSTAQEKFSFYFNMNTRASSKLTITGAYRFDVLLNKTSPGSASTELDPNISLRLTSSAVQMGVGYRATLRNEAVLSGATTTNLSTDSKEVYVDTGVHAGKLPDLRLRYSIRDQKQDSDGSPLSNTSTNEFRASMNYKIGIFSAIADYLNQSIKDKVGMTTTDVTQIASQLGMARSVGSKANMSLRENYSYNESAASGAVSSRTYSSISEGRLSYYPFKGANLGTNYIYRLSGDLFAGTGDTTEKTWFTSMNYSLPRFLKFYGSYNITRSESPGSATDSDATIFGANFSHRVGKVSFSSRYEKRYDNSHSSTAGSEPSDSKSSRDNIDWQMSAYLASYINLALSESYVINGSDDGTTTNNHYRLKLNLGPVKGLALSPYLDYTIDTPASGPATVTTEFVAPATLRLNLSRKLNFSLMDNYRWNQSKSSGTPSTTSSNTSSIRLTYAGPFPNTNMAGDATVDVSGSSGGTTTTTSTYNLRATWSAAPHMVNGNYRYQTGSNTTPSSAYSAQYGLNTRLNKLQFNFQARYEYTVTDSEPLSTSQSVYLVLNIRK